MNITLTEDMVATLRAKALEDQNDAELKYLAARRALEMAEKAFNESKRRYNATLKVRTGSSIALRVELTGYEPKVGAVVRDENDKRPDGWEYWNGYVIQSRSGGKPHEITVDGLLTAPNTKMACSCVSFQNRGRCWASTALDKGWSYNKYSMAYVVDDRGTKRILSIIDKPQGDFGLPK